MDMLFEDFSDENSIMFAREEAFEKGIEKVAKRMLKEGMEIKEIVKMTDFTEDRIAKLKKDQRVKCNRSGGQGV